jgi:class 3 adenylate cyclase
VNNPARILVVDDNQANRDILATRLKTHGYELVQAADGEQALAKIRHHRPDLILLDVMMPKLDGFEVCRRVKGDPTLAFTPIILITASADPKAVVTGLEAGADEYLTKPIDQAALVARVRSMLRVKALHDEVRKQAEELAGFNEILRQRVDEQVAELERMNRLKGFLCPQVAKLVLSSDDGKLLASHRREITVVFCDLRGFTAFAETAEPEEVFAILQEYYRCLGASVERFEGTLERFVGDGLLIFFNDPIPCPDPSVRAVRMAVEMRSHVAALAAKWQRFGHALGFGVGIAAGYATLGGVGYEGRFHYSAVGSVVNLGARLVAEALNGQILVDSKVQLAIEPIANTEPAGDLNLKGFRRPIRTFNVRELMH